jgi:S1/P1 Nuclease
MAGHPVTGVALLPRLLLGIAALLIASVCTAWGNRGHEAIALIAYRHLTPAAKHNLQVLLASDTDELTRSDFASRSVWADQYRSVHRETSAWHYVNIEIDHPDLLAACFGFPALPPGTPASRGGAEDCVVNKIEQFFLELKDPATPRDERVMALKFLVHFVGDLHQPLHAIDHRDRGGNCVKLNPSPNGHDRNLHAFWDVGTVEMMGSSPAAIAEALDRHISAQDLRAWTRGGAREWALESFELGQRDVYQLPGQPTCDDTSAGVALAAGYQLSAVRDARLQLAKAGVRLAGLLNGALGD